MATFTGLATLYFFFASIIGLFRFLAWTGCVRKTGVATGVSEPQAAFSPGGGKKVAYVYSVSIPDDDTSYSYTEKTGKDDLPALSLNEPTEFVMGRSGNTVITAGEYARLKKNLYLNPLYCLGSLGLTVLLTYIASSL